MFRRACIRKPENWRMPRADYPTENTMLLHQRMGHASKRTMIQAIRAGIYIGVKVTADEVINSNIHCQALCYIALQQKALPSQKCGQTS